MNRIFKSNLSLNNFKWLLTKLELSCIRNIIPRSRKRLWRSFISPLNGIIKVQFLEVTSLGLCGCNLKECSNGTRKGTIWHQIRISRSGDRQKMFWIVEVKIRGKINYMKEDHHSYICKFAVVIPVQRSTNNDCSILCSLKKLAACIVDGTHTVKTWTGLMKWNTFHRGEWIWKTFRYCYYLLGSILMSDDNVSLLQPIKTCRYSLCSKV